MADEEARKKQAELNARRAEVRKRLEEQSAKKQKKEQERKSQERRRIIDERCGQAKNLDGANEDELESLIETFQKRIQGLESDKWDIEYQIKMKDYQINELNIQVNDLRGKFIKPTLKKVSKYENKFAKLQKKAAEFNFRNQLKTVKKKEFELEEDKGKEAKPDWAQAGGPGAGKKEGEDQEGEEGEKVATEEAAPAPEEPPAEETPSAETVPESSAPQSNEQEKGAEEE